MGAEAIPSPSSAPSAGCSAVAVPAAVAVPGVLRRWRLPPRRPRRRFFGTPVPVVAAAGESAAPVFSSSCLLGATAMSGCSAGASRA
ncbi:MAG: hypothetical protein ACXVPP_12410 [Actinomycetota bacterium]